MSKNPVLPYAIIAVIGVLAVIIISFVGADQRKTAQNPEENNGGETVELVAEDIFKSNCASCHGGDLEGVSAPALNDVGGKYSVDEIDEIIMKGTDGGMPGGLVSAEEAAELAEWLSEMQE